MTELRDWLGPRLADPLIAQAHADAAALRPARSDGVISTYPSGSGTVNRGGRNGARFKCSVHNRWLIGAHLRDGTAYFKCPVQNCTYKRANKWQRKP